MVPSPAPATPVYFVHPWQVAETSPRTNVKPVVIHSGVVDVGEESQTASVSPHLHSPFVHMLELEAQPLLSLSLIHI